MAGGASKPPRSRPRRKKSRKASISPPPPQSPLQSRPRYEAEDEETEAAEAVEAAEAAEVVEAAKAAEAAEAADRPGVTEPAAAAAAAEIMEAGLPEEYICPITHEPMEDPVVTVDGQTYERRAIEQWLERHNISPLTGEELRNTMVIPCHALRSVIQNALRSQVGNHRK